ncbi:MAG: hypothetical protein Q8882_09330, partial [Bacillota bacterium]|nr:hypothetical protein [Bacillota bacterium]
MSVTSMKFITLMGDMDYFDEAILKYLSKYEIQLENALAELPNIRYAIPINAKNPYTDYVKMASALVPYVEGYKNPPPMSIEDAISVLSSAESDLKDYTEELNSLASEKAEALNITEQLRPLLSEDFRFEDLFNMKFITFRYGKIPLDSYKKLLNYVESSMSGEAIISQFFVDENNREYTYGMYFAPEFSHERADSIFSSLHFERIPLSDALQGTPKEEYEKAKETLERVEAELSNVESKKQYYIKTKDSSIASACKAVTIYDNAFNVRKYALTASSGSFSKRFALV